MDIDELHEYINNRDLTQIERSHTKGDYLYFHDSDKILQHQININYRNHRRDLSYPYLDEAEKSNDQFLNLSLTKGNTRNHSYKGIKFYGGLGFKYSDNYLIDTALGVHALYNNYSNKYTFEPTFEISNYMRFSHSLFGTLSLKRDYAYAFQIFPGTIPERLKTYYLNATLNIRYTENLQTNIRQNTYFISDSNYKNVTDISLMYGLATSTPWIWAGLGVERTSVSKTSPHYWSPSEFLAYGPRFEATFPIYNETISMGTAGGWNKQNDKDTSTSGIGYNASLRLEIGQRNENNFSLFYSTINSKQGENDYISQEAGLNINLFF